MITGKQAPTATRLPFALTSPSLAFSFFLRAVMVLLDHIIYSFYMLWRLPKKLSPVGKAHQLLTQGYSKGIPLHWPLRLSLIVGDKREGMIFY